MSDNSYQNPLLNVTHKTYYHDKSKIKPQLFITIPNKIKFNIKHIFSYKVYQTIYKTILLYLTTRFPSYISFQTDNITQDIYPIIKHKHFDYRCQDKIGSGRFGNVFSCNKR